VTETTTARGTEIGIPINDLETGVALLKDLDLRIEAGLIALLEKANTIVATMGRRNLSMKTVREMAGLCPRGRQ
jgi:hypothetical protein